MAIIYNNVDIENHVGVISAVHEMNAGGKSDILDIVFDDSEHLWPKWEPKIGDTIVYNNGGTSTGKMYVYDFSLENDEARIYASSMMPELRNIYSKTWEYVYLSQILEEVTPAFQLNAVDDVWFRYQSCDTKISSFINQLAEFESAVMIVFDDRVVIVNEQALEAQEAHYEIDAAGADVKVSDHTATRFDACIVQSGIYSGSFRISDGDRLYKPDVTIPCGSDAEAYRYAKALLRMANKQKTDIRWRGNLIPEMSAGITVNFVNESAPLWSGRMFCYRVRHDYTKGETTIYMRKPLEGY